MNRRPWTDADDQFLIDTYSTLSGPEQAARLGRSHEAVSRRRHDLRQRGRITGPRAVAREWTPSEEDALIHHVQDGRSVRWIARRLGRSPNAIAKRAHQLGGIFALRSQVIEVRTLHEVAKLFGVTQHVTDGWARNKWLRTQTNGAAQARVAAWRQRLVTDADILAFLQVREAWATWHVDGITDPDWKDEARTVRDGQGEWIACADLADRLGYSRRTLYGDAWLTALKPVKIGRYAYVWSENLIGFVPPLERERAA